MELMAVFLLLQPIAEQSQGGTVCDLQTWMSIMINILMEEAKTMKAIFLEGPMKFTIREVPIPQPLDGEVLIKVMAAPVNPSDLYFLHEGSYDHKKAPCIPGFEGSGVVVSSGGGLMGWGLLNKKVAFTPTMSSGSYSQYAIARSGECLPVDDSLSFQHASMSFVNPLTAMAFREFAKNKKVKTVIVDAAASALGKMLNRIIPPEKIEIINIVRKEEQVQVLRKEGANFILNSSDPEFDDKLSEMAAKMGATMCFDAIGGAMTGRILNCMPKHSIIYVYGILDGPSVHQIDIKNFIHKNCTVTGFFLPNWLQNRGLVKLLPTMYKLRKLLKHQLKSQISLQFSLQQFEDSVKWYTQNMTKGKVILNPFHDGRQKEVEIKQEEQHEQKREIQRKDNKKKEDRKEELEVKEKVVEEEKDGIEQKSPIKQQEQQQSG